MADKCDPIRNRLQALEEALADARREPGEKPAPGINGLLVGIRRAKEELQVCVRRWTVTGAFFPAAHQIDAVVKTFMMNNNVRALSIAFAKAGALLGNRGYTWAEPDYRITQPDTLFRVASVSKLFTCAVIDRLTRTASLTEARPLTLGRAAFPFLGITASRVSGKTPDPDINKITVNHLAIRRSGMPEGFGVDFGKGEYREIANMLGIKTVPTVMQIAEFMFSQPLEHRPGEAGINDDGFYSNSAFGVLTAIAERAAAPRSFIQYLRDELLAPLGISDVHVGGTRENQRRYNEVPTYDAEGTGPSNIDLSANAVAPKAYGGAFQLETTPGIGGLVMSSGTVARFIGDQAVWDIGGRQPGLTRYGNLDGSGSIATSRGDGIDFAIVFNRNLDNTEFNSLAAQIHAILNRRGDGAFAFRYDSFISIAYSIVALFQRAIKALFRNSFWNGPGR